MDKNARKYVLAFATALLITITLAVFHLTQSFLKDFAEGQRFFKQGDYSMALAYFSPALRAKPDNKDVLRYLAVTYGRLGRKHDALEKMERLEQFSDKDSRMDIQLADVYYELGYFEKAERFYRKVLQKHKTPATQRKLAEALAWQKKYDHAIGVLEQLPESRENIELMADIYTWEKEYDKAIMLYNRLIASKKATPDVILKLADALRFAKRDEEAIVLYEQYILMHDGS